MSPGAPPSGAPDRPAPSDRRFDAATLLACHDRGRSLPRDRPAPLTDLAQAEAIQNAIVALRIARGERPRGYKIGFTNRSIWPVYGVFHPIWGPVYDTTLTLLDNPQSAISIDNMIEPRLEPEIALGLAGTPASSAPGDLIEALDWYAQAFEVVDCPYPDWKFTAAEAIAAQSLHAALLVGPRRPIAELQDPVGELAALQVELVCDDRRIAAGTGAAALDGPVQALGHLVAELAKRGTRLGRGDVVTTGTLTDAQRMRPGQTWRCALTGTRLSGLTLRVLA
jgi:2-keto-4-pentenoate hydratase